MACDIAAARGVCRFPGALAQAKVLVQAGDRRRVAAEREQDLQVRARALAAALLRAHVPRCRGLAAARGVLLDQPGQAWVGRPRPRVAALVVPPRRRRWIAPEDWAVKVCEGNFGEWAVGEAARPRLSALAQRRASGCSLVKSCRGRYPSFQLLCELHLAQRLASYAFLNAHVGERSGRCHRSIATSAADWSRKIGVERSSSAPSGSEELGGGRCRHPTHASH